MGWASAGDIFDPVARALIDAGVAPEVKTRVLGALISALQDGDWDTEPDSLEQFKDDEAVAEAFRQHGVIITCNAIREREGATDWCERERGHPADYHEDGCSGDRWPVT